MTKRQESCERVDRYPAEIRQLIHEFGQPIVEACLQAKITKPAMIPQLVTEIWAGARQTSQRGGAEGTLDWVLMQAGATISAARLERVLNDYCLRIVPIDPTAEMIAASMAEVGNFNQRVTKSQKHRLRLTAAVRACKPRFRLHVG